MRASPSTMATPYQAMIVFFQAMLLSLAFFCLLWYSRDGKAHDCYYLHILNVTHNVLAFIFDQSPRVKLWSLECSNHKISTTIDPKDPTIRIHYI